MQQYMSWPLLILKSLSNALNYLEQATFYLM